MCLEKLVVTLIIRPVPTLRLLHKSLSYIQRVTTTVLLPRRML